MPSRRVLISRLLIGLAVLLSVAACDFQSKYFRKVDLDHVNRWAAPYHGFNMELNLAGFGMGFFPEGDYGVGLDVVSMNIFYSLALGVYLHAGMPMYDGVSPCGLSPGWLTGGGLIYQPVASWILKPYLQVGAGGMQWTGPGSSHWSPMVEAALGIATAFNYRGALDFHVARDLDPLAGQEPWILSVRLNLIGFSLVSFKREGHARQPGESYGHGLQ